MPTTFFTIEVYNRRKWSDKYSCRYPTKEEAAERARELYNEYELNENFQDSQPPEPIHACYRIKEIIEETLIHELS
jgi:hypothetical protein